MNLVFGESAILHQKGFHDKVIKQFENAKQTILKGNDLQFAKEDFISVKEMSESEEEPREIEINIGGNKTVSITLFKDVEK